MVCFNAMIFPMDLFEKIYYSQLFLNNALIISQSLSLEIQNRSLF